MSFLVLWENQTATTTIQRYEPHYYDYFPPPPSFTFEFDVDIFLITSIMKERPFCPQWIEIGTSNGVEALWLRMILPERVSLVSYDTHDDRLHSITDTSNIFFTNNEKSLLELINSVKRMQITVIHDTTSISHETLNTLADSLPDLSMILMPHTMVRDGTGWRYFSESEYWNDISSTIGSDMVILKKSIEINVGEFPWELYPSELMSRDAISMHNPVEFNPETDWILFLRIQKCGTKTLTTIINTILHTRDCSRDFAVTIPADNIDCSAYQPCSEILPTFKEDNSRKTCRVLLQQHCDWEDIFTFWNPDSPGVYPISIIRNPIYRTISEYKHVYRTNLRVWDYCIREEKGEDFSRDNFLLFLKDEKHKTGMRNRQTRMIAGCGSTQTCEQMYPDEQYMLEVAKLHLLQCLDVGTVEQFSDFLVRLTILFGWELESYTIEQEGRDAMKLDWDVDGEITVAILQLNNLDYELFQFASALSDYRMEQLKAREGRVLPRYECENNHCFKVSYDD